MQKTRPRLVTILTKHRCRISHERNNDQRQHIGIYCQRMALRDVPIFQVSLLQHRITDYVILRIQNHFSGRPDQEVIDSVTPLLLAENATNNMLLSISSVVHSFCSRVAQCSEHETIIPAVIFLEERLNQTVTEGGDVDKVNITLPKVSFR